MIPIHLVLSVEISLVIKRERALAFLVKLLVLEPLGVLGFRFVLNFQMIFLPVFTLDALNSLYDLLKDLKDQILLEL